MKKDNDQGEYISSISIPKIKAMLAMNGFDIRTWDYELGYIKIGYEKFPDTDFSIILSRVLEAAEYNWDENIWAITFKVSSIISGISAEEMHLLTDLMDCLHLTNDSFIRSSELTEEDRDKIDDYDREAQYIVSGG